MKPVVQLTVRERQVLKLVANGQATKNIADNLAVSENTVEFHRKNLYRKLGIHSVAEATRMALQVLML